MFNSLMPSLNIRSLPFVVFMGGFPSRLQNLSSGAIRPGGLLFLFWHVASLGWYQCIVKIWIWLNHPKGHFERSERSNLAPFLLGGNFLKNCLITFSLFMQEASQGG